MSAITSIQFNNSARRPKICSPMHYLGGGIIHNCFNNPYASSFLLKTFNNNSNILCYTNLRNGAPVSFRAKLAEDTVSFSLKPVSKKDFLTLSKDEIIQKISDSIKPENFLGNGSQAVVYRIPDTNYCVRFVHSKIYDKNLQKFKTDLSFNLSEQDKINHVVAKLGRDCCILNYIEGQDCFRYKNKKELVNLPQDSYYSLFRQICYAKENNMIFDCNSTNVIYNPKDKTLTAIDFLPQNEDCPENVLPLSYMLVPLRIQDNKNNKFDYKANKKLAASLLLVGLRDFEPKAKPAMSVFDYDFKQLLSRIDVICFERTAPPQFDILKKIISEITLLKFKESYDLDVSNELNTKLKVAKAIINQLFMEDDVKPLAHIPLDNRFSFL